MNDRPAEARPAMSPVRGARWPTWSGGDTPAHTGRLVAQAAPRPFLGRARPLRDTAALFDRSAKLAVLGIFMIVFIYALDAWDPFLVPVTMAVVLGLMLGPPMALIERTGLPSGLAAIVVLLALAAGLFLLVMALAPAFTEWSGRLPELWDAIDHHFRDLRAQLQAVEDIQKSVEEAAGGGEATPTVEVRGPTFIENLLSFAPPAMGQVVLFLAVLFFYLATRNQIRETLLTMCIGRAARLRAARIIRDVERTISGYLLTIALINVGLGIATGLALWAIGVPSPALWGAVAAVLNFVQYIGPLAFVFLITAVGLVTYDTLGAALLPTFVYLGLNLIESQFVTPGILGRRLTLNPFMIILALGFWMWIWGPIGAFLAVPLLIICVVIFTHVVPRGNGPIRRPGRRAAPEPSPAPEPSTGPIPSSSPATGE